MLIAKYALKGPAGNRLIIGLTRANLNTLLSGRGIAINKRDAKEVPDGWEIDLVFGENENAIQQNLQAPAKVVFTPVLPSFLERLLLKFFPNKP